MKKILLSGLVALGTMPSLAVYAESTPVSRGADQRVQVVRYNPDDVVRINTKAGIATHIILNQDESYQTHAFGDADAWTLAAFNNSVFIKPKIVNGTTNLVVVTDKRIYNFFVDYTKKDTFEVKFVYPDEEKAKAEMLARVNNTDYELNLLKNRFVNKKINLAYKMRGASSVAPINVWDDGTFTYFKFGNNTDLPAIYSVDDEDKESLFNRTTLGKTNNIVMLHGISQKWRLRISDSALDVHNDAFNKVGNDMASGTVTDKVNREVKP